MHSHSELRFLREQTTQICSGTISSMLPTLLPKGRVVAIVDAEVDALHNISELIPESVLIPAGEENKNMQLVEMLWQELADSKVGRDVFLLGVGGGVVCDIVGFVASTWMRGVRFGLVPTTLLAQVDAAIGGKCGVNFGGYKNMVGAFAPAEFVLCDAELLTTLPEREFRSALSEMIKAAIIGDGALFELFERNDYHALRSDATLLGEMVRRSVEVKRDIVSRDPYESGVRRLLNLGHTMAHAIESLTTEYNHGEAVAIGLAYVARKAVAQGVLPQSDGERIVGVIERYGLPTSVELDEEALEEAMQHDKKNRNGEIGWVMPHNIGNLF
ncbi:MAG: 3-dehydroquinate synthase [Tidjanibacter sp.]|nr:3-dehydroquinate synthase [Tidjanibacter sp.]